VETGRRSVLDLAQWAELTRLRARDRISGGGFGRRVEFGGMVDEGVKTVELWESVIVLIGEECLVAPAVGIDQG
jgi:hypothetical protein